MFTQPRDPNNKTKPAYKKYCSYCHRTNHSISACFKKQRDDEDKRDKYARSKSPQKSFVQYFRSSSNDRTQRYDTRPNEYPTRYRSRSTSRHDYQKPNTQRSISRTRYNYDRTTTPPHYTRSRYDNYQRDSCSHRSPYRSSYRSPHKRDSHSRYRSRSYSRDNNFSRYTSSYRPPSRPRDSRYSRSRSHSQTRNKINTIQQQNSNDPINFEIHMYHPTEMANALTPTSWFYSLYTHTPSNQIHRDYPSRLEISFLLDSGASISVLNHPTYITIAKLLNIKQTSPHNSSKTLTVANQTEVPILHYITITLNTTIEDNSRQFTIPFAVADIKYNILGTPFFEENIQNINIQDFTLHFKNYSRVYPNYAKFTSLLSKDYPYFSYIYRINSKTQIRLKPNTSKIAHFPINNYYNLHFSTTPQKQFFPTISHTYFSSKFRTTFNFIEVFTDDKPDTCATIIQNSTNHIATLPTGHIGYIEVPITNEKPKYYQVNDINTLIHNVTHTYHPEITEIIPPTNYSTTTEQQPIPPTQFSLNQVYMTDADSLPHSPSLYNVQPTSHSSKPRVFPSLPYSPENLKFINKFSFQFSDLTDTEYITLCNLLLKHKTCYATHINDVGKIATPFRIRLKPNAQLLTQRPSKVPIHYRDKLNTLLKDLEKHNIIKQIGSSPQDKPVYGTTYLNPLIIIPKGDSIKCVLDARHLNSNTEQSDESWPIEPLAPQLARANKKYKSAIDLMYAYAHTPLDEETIKLTSFSSGDKLFAFIRGFYGLKGLPNFFTKQMSSFFKTLFEQGFALVYIDDILLLSNSKEHMFQLIEQLHNISTKNNLKLAPEKSFFMLLKVKFLGHEIGYNTIKPIHSKISAIHKIPSPTGKVALMSFIGALNFYTKFIDKLHINLKPFYDLLHKNTTWKWTDDHERLFQTLKNSLTADTELTIPITKHPFFITVDASLIGLGAVLFQLNDHNQMKVISYNSRILNPQEQKLSTLERELLGIVHALQIYEFIIIGSPHPIHVFTDHKPLLHCFTKKGNLSPRFYRAQMQLTKFSKLKIIHTPGKNLSVADLPSRSFTKEELQINQLKHKHLPPQIDFTILQNNKLQPVHYLIKHEEVLPHQKHDSHPILADYGTDQFSLRINDKGNDIIVKPLNSFSFNAITPFQTKFKAPAKKHNKSLHQQSLLLNDTDVTSDDDDHIYTRIPKTNSSFIYDTTLKEQETFSTITKPKPTITPKSNSETTSAIDVQPNSTSMTHSSQLVPFYDPSLFKYKLYFQGFFLPDDYSLDLKTLQVQQSQDPVLRTVHSWIINNEKPEFLTPLITGNLFLHAYYKRFTQLFIDTTTNLISLHTTHPLPPETHPISIPHILHDTIRICLPFRMFQTVFNKLHDHSHTGIKITYNTFSQYYYIPYFEKWLSIFIHDCLECQKNKHFNMKIQTAPTQSFSEHAPCFNYRISMDTKGPINPPSQHKSYIHVIVDAFSHFVVTVPIKSNNAKTAVKTLLHHWITKYGPPIYLVTDRGTEYVNQDMAHLCTLMGIRHSPRTAYSPWANGLVEVQNRNLGTHLRMFLHNTPANWAFQVHMYAYAHNSQPISELNVSPYEIVFHTRPRIPLTFDLNLNRNTSKTCISQYCSQLPEHSHYDKTDLNPFFYKTLSKPIPQWFLAVETAMLQIYSTVYYYTLKKLNSHAYITKTYHEGKPLPIGTFVLKRHFAHVHFSDKLKPLRIGPYKILDRLSDVTYELLAQDGSTLHVHRNHIIPYYPKEPLLYPHLRNFMRFSDSINFDIPKPIQYANSDSSPFNSDESLSDDTSVSDNDQPLSPNNISPQTSSNTNPSSTINLPFQSIPQTLSTNHSRDRTRHQSQNQSPSPSITNNRDTKTHYNLRQQPKMDYRIFIPPSKL